MRSARDRADLKTLKRILGEVLAKHGTDSIIRPHELATEVMKNPEINERAKYLFAHLQIRQILRGMLRHPPKLKHPVLPHLPLIQYNYPVADGEGYAPVNALTQDDWLFNVSDLQKGGRARLAHADQLYQWGVEHFGLKDTLPKGGQL